MALIRNVLHAFSILKRKNTLLYLLTLMITVAVLTSLIIYEYQPDLSKHSPFNPVSCTKCASHSTETENLDPTLWIPKEPFVYYKWFGGLGNQLFQFACVYTIAKKNKLPLLVYVDRSPDSGVAEYRFSHGEFALSLFNVPLPRYDTKGVKLIHDYIEKARNQSRVQELHDKNILSQDYTVTNSILVLNDYCQSEIFFQPYRDEIRKMFRPKNLNTPSIVKWKTIIKGINQSCDSVCVHVRRGDFTRTSNRLVNTNFYTTAIDDMRHRLREKRKSPVYFFFSDDIEAVRTDFMERLSVEIFDQLQWVSGPKNSLVEDLYLMSQCQHNIMSASSFGWWGAYLNDNQEKIVIAAHYKTELFKDDPFHTFLYRNMYYPMEWFIQDANFVN